jgi:hypothetical protein
MPKKIQPDYFSQPSESIVITSQTAKKSSFESISRLLKGGAGSGNFGHSGRPGEQGGSSSTPGSVKGIGRIKEKALEEVEKWGGERAKYAKAAVNAIRSQSYGTAAYDEAGELKGIASSNIYTSNSEALRRIAEAEGIKVDEQVATGYSPPYPEFETVSTKEYEKFFSDNLAATEIGFMATAPGTKGFGRRMAEKIIRSARTGMVEVLADKGAVGFWKKMGFKPVGKPSTYKHKDFGRITSQPMYMTAADAKKFRKADAGEPESGIYCWPSPQEGLTMFKRLKPLLKGGPGSGNFGHAGREGERGGSGEGGGGDSDTSDEELYGKPQGPTGESKPTTPKGKKIKALLEILEGKDYDPNLEVEYKGKPIKIGLLPSLMQKPLIQREIDRLKGEKD